MTHECLEMSKNFLKIYIAAPYSADTEEERRKNTEAVIDTALVLFKKGHFPYIPHLTHWVDKQAKKTKIVMESIKKGSTPFLLPDIILLDRFFLTSYSE